MKELAAALAKAQGAIKNAIKDSVNTFFQNSKYADLASVWDACRAPLSENGLAVLQVIDYDGPEMVLKTILIHTSGESVESRYPIRPEKPTPQGFGSAITYARRYCLSAMVGIASEVDDDGNAASVADVGKKASPKPDVQPKPQSGPSNPNEPKILTALAAKERGTFKPIIDELYQCQSTAEIDGWRAKNKAEFDVWPLSWVNMIEEKITNHVDTLASQAERT